MNYEMTIRQMLDAAGPVSRFEPAQTAELISGLANAVRLLTEQRDELLAEREADKALIANYRQRIAELERQLIAPLPIGELIQRLSDQTGEDWSEKYLEARTLTVKLPKDAVRDASDFSWHAEVVPVDVVKEALAEQGITLVVGGE